MDENPLNNDTSTLDQIDLDSIAQTEWENGTEQDDFDGIHESPSKSSSNADAELLENQEGIPPSLSLQDYLRLQMQDLRLSPEDWVALNILVDSTNEDGYLLDSLLDIAITISPSVQEQEELLVHLRCALKLLQSMDPAGVGAMTLGECLALQLRRMPRSETQVVAILICKNHLDLLARRDIKKLMVATGVEEAQVKQAHHLIQKLEPKPGRPFSRAEDNIIVPDVIVKRQGRHWKVLLNPDVMPKLRINDLYAKAIKSHRAPKQEAGAEEANTLNSKLQEARWFVKNIVQRFETIERVARAIVERQKNFLSHGALAMKPLVLREIADELGLHESTISRVTTAKYMATPMGTFELKYFFGSSLSTQTGSNASSTAVRALIQQLIDKENPRDPLSDSNIAALLESQGIHVARRTVAKYREALKIPPTVMRKIIE